MRVAIISLSVLLFVAGSTEAIPNPSAVYCHEMGYDYETRTHPDGGQYGVCVFPDGSECRAWAFYQKCYLGEASADCNWPCRELPCRGAGESVLIGECCEGLSHIRPANTYGPDCNDLLIVVGGTWLCSDCGNGVCESWESKCNCPEDCRKPRVFYVDDDGPADFNNIQAAINDANDGDTIVVQTGLYKNDMYFLGKNVILTSTNPKNIEIVKATIIGCEDDEAKITFSGNENANCILIGFNINGYVKGCETRIAPICECENRTHATISNCIFQGNCGLCGIVIMCCDGKISNCLIADNRQCSHCPDAFIYPAINDCHGQIINCTISNNNGCISVFATDGAMTIKNCIIYNSDSSCEYGVIYIANGELNTSYNNVKGGLDSVISNKSIINWGPANICADPCFADPCNGDYHLKSQAGHWGPKIHNWIKDDVTSPCIDAGDPMSPIGLEPFPNGGRINMGAYGGTVEASKSYFSEPPCETIIAGDINGDCKVDWQDLTIMAMHWLQRIE